MRPLGAPGRYRIVLTPSIAVVPAGVDRTRPRGSGGRRHDEEVTWRRPADPRRSAPVVDVLPAGVRAPVRRASPTRSTLLGVVVLAVAVGLAVTVPQLLAAPLGRATRAPLPSPPVVGSCLASANPNSTDSPNSTGMPESFDGTALLTAVACETPHQAEVVATWQADDPLVASLWRFSGYLNRHATGLDRTMGGVTDALVDACWHAVQAYVGPSQLAAQWYPVQPRVVPALLPAPVGEGSGRWRWLACVVAAGDGGTWEGTLRWQQAQPHPRPATLAVTCSSAETTGVQRCDRPHRTEVLGWPDHSRPTTADDAAASCAAHAVLMTGRADPTYGGRIRIGLQEQPAEPVDALPLCVAELVGQGQLIGSLVGIGDAALPVA